MSSERKREDLGAEFPRGDLLQVVMLLSFLVVWGLDSFVYHLSTVLGCLIPLAVRLTLAGVSIGLALVLVGVSHRALLDEVRDPPAVVDTGVYGRVRHPMYLGILLIYVGFILATWSVIALAMWLGIVFSYDRMASYEEEDLTRMFGEEYAEYQRRVPKWLPRLA